MKKLNVTFRLGTGGDFATESGCEIIVDDKVADSILHPDKSWESVSMQAYLTNLISKLAILQTGCSFICSEVIDIREVEI